MHYLVTEASQALLPSLWWMVLSAPQWPQWLASPDTTLNGFSRNLIAPQFPKDTTILWLPLQSPSAGWKLKFNQRAFFLGTDLSPFQALFYWKKKCSKGRTKMQRKHVISQHRGCYHWEVIRYFRIKFSTLLLGFFSHNPHPSTVSSVELFGP